VVEATIRDANNSSDSSSEQDANDSSDSSTEQTGGAVESQSGAETIGEEENLPFNEHPRWKELIKERNELRKQTQENSVRMQELEEQLKARPSEPAKTSTPDARAKLIQRYVNLGYDEQDAAGLVDDYAELNSQLTMQPLKNMGLELGRIRFQNQIDEFRGSPEGKDFDELEPIMLKKFNSMSEEMKQQIAINPNGLQILYDLAKIAKERVGKKEKSKGQANIMGNAGTSGASKPKWTREKIKALSDDEYEKKSTEIHDAMLRGDIE